MLISVAVSSPLARNRLQRHCRWKACLMIQQRIDLGDHLRFRFSELGDWQGLCQRETASSAAAEAHMHLDPLTVDQRHIFDQQAENAFSLARFDGRVIPYSRKIPRQGEQLFARLGIDQRSLLLRLLLELFLCFGKRTELVVPLRFQAVGNQPVFRVDLHVTTASEFSLVLCSLNVLPPQRIGFSDSCLNFLLNGEGDLKSHRLHQFQQEVADRLIDNPPRHALAGLLCPS